MAHKGDDTSSPDKSPVPRKPMMKHCVRLRSGLVALFILLASRAGAQQPAPTFKPPDSVAYRTANIMSEGVRLSAEVYSPKEPAGQRLPTVILCHGWGGTAALLRRQALDFARAGYLAISFDYRGWGASEGRGMLTPPRPPAQRGR